MIISLPHDAQNFYNSNNRFHRKLSLLLITFFHKLPKPENSEATFGSSSPAVACPVSICSPLMVEASHCLLYSWNAKKKSYAYQFIVFGLTRPRNEPESTVCIREALSTRPLTNSAQQTHLLQEMQLCLMKIVNLMIESWSVA